MIATRQNLANLIPALQCGTTQVWIRQTAALRVSGVHLASALKVRQIRFHRNDFDGRDVQTLRAQAAALADRLDSRPVTINDILLAQGCRWVEGTGGNAACQQETAMERKAYTRRLDDRANAPNVFFGSLNDLAAQDAGLLVWGRDDRFTFRDLAAANYLAVAAGWKRTPGSSSAGRAALRAKCGHGPRPCRSWRSTRASTMSPLPSWDRASGC